MDVATEIAIYECKKIVACSFVAQSINYINYNVEISFARL